MSDGTSGDTTLIAARDARDLARRREASRSALPIEQAAARRLSAPSERPSPQKIDAVDTARADEYAFLATLLAQPPDAAFLERIARLRGDGTLLGTAHAALADAARSARAEDVEQEFFDLFVGVGRGELLPYGSYYLTGFLNERPLARLRGALQALGIARADGQSEPEDHAAVLCEIMAGLARGDFAASADAQQHFFEGHLAPWIGRFFSDLEGAKAGDFYRFLGTVGRVFTGIEREAFTLAARLG